MGAQNSVGTVIGLVDVPFFTWRFHVRSDQSKQAIRTRKISRSGTTASTKVWKLHFKTTAQRAIFVAGAPPILKGSPIVETRFLIPPQGGRGFKHAVLVYEVNETNSQAVVESKIVAVPADDLWRQLNPGRTPKKKHMGVNKRLAQLSQIMKVVMTDYTHVGTDAWALTKVTTLRQLALAGMRQAQLQNAADRS